MEQRAASNPVAPPPGWGLALDRCRPGCFGKENHQFIAIQGLLHNPEAVIDAANLQDFARITPHYPGLRAPLPLGVGEAWLEALGPLLDSGFGCAGRGWTIEAWFSIVTCPPAALQPIQRLPHVDGTDPRQVAMMLYLHRTGHGGTAFYRHRATGLSALGEADYPHYARTLQREVAARGLPPARYPTDGAPHFERIHSVPGHFNSAVFYRGNVLHSGVIDNAAPLPVDPRRGRLTINAFFRPRA